MQKKSDTKNATRKRKKSSPNRVRFKDLTEEQKEYLAVTYLDENLSNDEKMLKCESKFGVKGRTVRSWWVKLNLHIPNSKLPEQLQIARNRNIDSDAEILLITSAQNTTSINYNMFEGMKKLAETFDKKGFKTNIVVIPIRYRNPTSPTEDISKKNNSSQWWADEVNEYLYYNKIQFGDVKVACDVHKIPTVANPLNRLNAIAESSSLVIGHPRIHSNTLPRFRGEPLRMMNTSGSLTVMNYSRSGSGDNAQSHHSYGFCIVEKKKDGTCHMPRNVYADLDGNFTDLSYSWDGEKIKKTKSAKALIMGDIHRELLNKDCYGKTKEITSKIKVENVILHDVLDGYRFNPHERKDPYINRKKIVENKYLIEKEIKQAVKFPLDALKKLNAEKVYVVESNHDNFLDRHISDMDWKKDLHNSHTYLKYAHIQQTVNLEKHGCLFGYLVNQKYEKEKRISFIPYGNSLRISDFQVGLHGDAGVNGARGNINSFKRLNTKMIHGHSHSPMVRDGVTCVGISCEKDQYYTRRGMSSHAYGHCFIFDNGKRQLIVFGDDMELSHFI